MGWSKFVSPTSNIFDDRKSFSTFVYDLHNVVNQALGKCKFMSYDHVRRMYERFRARCYKPEGGSKEEGCTKSVYGVPAECNIMITARSEEVCDKLAMDPAVAACGTLSGGADANELRKWIEQQEKLLGVKLFKERREYNKLVRRLRAES